MSLIKRFILKGLRLIGLSLIELKNHDLQTRGYAQIMLIFPMLSKSIGKMSEQLICFLRELVYSIQSTPLWFFTLK